MVREVTVADLAQAHRDGAVVVDVREPHEYVEGHVPGAILIPMAQLADRAGDLPTGGRVYVICRSGNRSKASTSLLEARGFDAVSVAGGTMAWIEAGHDVVTGTKER